MAREAAASSVGGSHAPTPTTPPVIREIERIIATADAMPAKSAPRATPQWALKASKFADGVVPPAVVPASTGFPRAPRVAFAAPVAAPSPFVFPIWPPVMAVYDADAKRSPIAGD